MIIIIIVKWWKNKGFLGVQLSLCLLGCVKVCHCRLREKLRSSSVATEHHSKNKPTEFLCLQEPVSHQLLDLFMHI